MFLLSFSFSPNHSIDTKNPGSIIHCRAFNLAKSIQIHRKMSSPSEFLTFYRRTVLSSSSSRLIQRSTRTPVGRTSTSLRRFGASATCYKQNLSTDSSTKTDKYPDDEHTVNKTSKNDNLDIQSANAQDALK